MITKSLLMIMTIGSLSVFSCKSLKRDAAKFNENENASAAKNIIAGDTILSNATVVDPATQKTYLGHLIISNGIIKNISKDAVLSGVTGTRIDLKGKWIMPALIDLHVHAFGNQALDLTSEPQETKHSHQYGLTTTGYLGLEGAAKVMAQAGVGAFLDLFGVPTEFFPVRDKQRKNPGSVADIYGSGPCITSPKGHCDEYGVPTTTISSASQAKAAITDIAQYKPDVIKIVYDSNSPKHGLTNLDKASMSALIKEATALNLKHFSSGEDGIGIVKWNGQPADKVVPTLDSLKDQGISRWISK